MATVQINARIESETKQAGDQALRAAGYAPSQAIRVLWGFAERNRHDPASLKSALRMLEGNDADEADEAFRRKVEQFGQGPLIYKQALLDMGVSDIEASTPHYEDLLAQAHLEKELERGLA